MRKHVHAKATFQNVILHQGSEAGRFGDTYLVPLSVILGVQGTGVDETPAFIPFDLVGSEQLLLRYANMYEQFKIDWIEVQFEPVSRPPTTVISDGDPVTAAALAAWQKSWVIKFPYGTNEDLNEMGGIRIDKAFEDPRILFRQTFKKFKLWWRPRIKGNQNMIWMSDNDGALAPAEVHASNQYQGRRFPWCSFITWTLMNGGGGRTYTTHALRQIMSEPYVGLISAAGNRVETVTHCPYKIIIRSGWSFRGARKMTTQFITSLEEKDPFPVDED